MSHLYCSPWLAATSGSRHGYDVIDHGRINPELGGREGLQRLRAACDEAGMSIVLDIVPNHASVAAPESANAAWWEVLRDGPDSRFAKWFDIDWESPDNPGKVLVPVLGRPIAECLEAGEFVASRERLRYFDHVLPLAAGTEELPLEELLEAQYWRLCLWKVGSEELNYRRFFDVTTLAGLRVEDPEVFAATHREILASVADGTVSGLRVDHPDGLSDPKGYLARLSEASRGCWIVVEKILEADEQLPADWACHGTTGYDTLNCLTGVFVDPAGEEPLTRLYDDITETAQRWPIIAEDAKRQVLDSVLSAELSRLTELAIRAAWAQPRYRDLTRRGVREAFAELLTQFDVYRAYVRPGERPDAEATKVLTRAREGAIKARPDRSDEIEAVCDLVVNGPDALVVRFAQTTGPVMAKGVEDTAFYRYGRLLALNEVGGDPSRFGVPVADFHEWATRIQQRWPLTMTTLSTHDTKRSEDVRARLVLLSEDTRRWQRVVTRLMTQAQKHAGPAGPEPATQYLIFQTLVGAFPIDEERLGAYLSKAIREAKLHTSWTAPDEAYEAAVQAYLERDPRRPHDHDGCRGVRRRAGRTGPGQCARHEAPAADHAGHPGHVSGQRAVGPVAGGSGQPPPRSISASGPGSWRRWIVPAPTSPASTTRARPSCIWCAPRCACGVSGPSSSAPRRSTCRFRSPVRRPSTSWPSAEGRRAGGSGW